MALDPTSQDPCSLLNATGYPNLFVQPTAQETTAYPLIATAGVPVTFVSSLASSTLTNAILNNPSPSSTFRLIQFLSAGGVAAADPSKHYNQLSFVALSQASGTGPYEGIVDTFFNAVLGATSNYDPTLLTSTTQSLLTTTNIWNPNDSSNGAMVEHPISILGRIIKKKYLIAQSDIYIPSQLDGTGVPESGTESLIYLYKLLQTQTLSAAQQARQNTLETTNLRFFGAFMAEYCYYRTRYEWLLKKYFTIYTQTATTYSTSQTNAAGLFGGLNPMPATSTATSLKQSDYLSALAYHLAALNMRMIDMRTVLTSVNTYYNSVFLQIQAAINSNDEEGSNKNLIKSINALQSSSSVASKYLQEQDFAQEAMTYNSEKNRYSNILLGLYAFLNVAALAVVFQVVRS